MKKTFLIALISTAAVVGVAGAQTPLQPFESNADPQPQGRIDELVFGRLKQLGIAPARLCSDEVFLRRAYLDVIGTLPTADEARQFLKDADPDKRRKLVDRLLEREEHADYWAMRWCDSLRVKSEFPINLWPNAVQAYHRWIRTCVKENLPYDRFAREMLVASGSNFRKPQVNFYRAMQSREPRAIAQAVALTFMGVRAEKWPQERLAGMAAFFSLIAYKPTTEWKEEIVLFDLDRAATDATARTLQTAAFPDGTPVRLSPGQDPREAFADWLIAPKNPWFARNIVNRVWFWLLGRGLIHEPDDIRPDNPPSNPELLALLEHELIASRYDLKHLCRQIMNSTTYQLSHIPRSENPQAEANFAHYLLRPVEAEVLIDALCQITGTSEQYSSVIPEPYTFIPEDQRSIALADASITSPFLEKFGRSPRDTGWQCERNLRPTATQRLHLLNSSHIRRKIEQGPKLGPLLRPTGSQSVRGIVEELYLTVLSRFPLEEELNTVDPPADRGRGRRHVVAPRDLAWALINSPEFLHRH
jgi:hypothetical protein